jgi:hypothetical protein
MRSGLLFLALAFTSLAAAPERKEAQAQVLDHNERLCSNCFFGVSAYYYCFKADDKILIGYQKTRTLNWVDPKQNSLVKAHKGWATWSPENATVPLSYDDKNIWVTRPDGKKVKLTQDYATDIFVNNGQCRAAVKKKAE